ncbi:hypothetical protein CS542_03535 [Pedobacter sp. IW39]|nr:hypothetical protein CS542_03535 [Pedobacter sp. IW39]
MTKLFSYASLINAVLAFGMESTYFRYLNKHEDKRMRYTIIPLLYSLYCRDISDYRFCFADSIASWINNGEQAQVLIIKDKYFVGSCL